MNKILLFFGLLLYGVVGSMLINSVRFSGVERIRSVFSVEGAIVFAVVALIPLVYFSMGHLKTIWGRSVLFLFACLISPAIAHIGGVVGFILVAGMMALVREVHAGAFAVLESFIATHESLAAVIMLVLTPSIVGGLSILTALLFFIRWVDVPKHFIISWILFSMLLPVVLSFFVDMTPFGDFAADSTDNQTRNILPIKTVTFFWQAGILFLIAFYFSRFRPPVEIVNQEPGPYIPRDTESEIELSNGARSNE